MVQIIPNDIFQGTINSSYSTYKIYPVKRNLSPYISYNNDINTRPMTAIHKPISEYKEGDEVQILTNNPRENNREEWRPAVVLEKRIIHPSFMPVSPQSTARHKPYPILIVRTTRTYCNATPVYRWIDGNIPVFVDNLLTFYDKQNDEGILYANHIRPVDNRSIDEVFADMQKSFYTVPQELQKKS